MAPSPDISPAEEPCPSEAPARRPWIWLPLAHHRRSDRDRCVFLPLGSRQLALCARCLALYPVLALLLVLQGILNPPGLGLFDWALVLGASLPALLDWGLAWLGWRRGSTSTRMVSGALLGLALGRSFWLYFHDPLSELFWIQLFLLAAAAATFEVLRQLQLWRSGP